MRFGSLLGLTVIFLGVPLLMLSFGLALAVMYLGAALFCLANYTAYRIGEDR